MRRRISLGSCDHPPREPRRLRPPAYSTRSAFAKVQYTTEPATLMMAASVKTTPHGAVRPVSPPSRAAVRGPATRPGTVANVLAIPKVSPAKGVRSCRARAVHAVFSGAPKALCEIRARRVAPAPHGVIGHVAAVGGGTQQRGERHECDRRGCRARAREHEQARRWAEKAGERGDAAYGEHAAQPALECRVGGEAEGRAEDGAHLQGRIGRVGPRDDRKGYGMMGRTCQRRRSPQTGPPSARAGASGRRARRAGRSAASWTACSWSSSAQSVPNKWRARGGSAAAGTTVCGCSTCRARARTAQR